MASSLKKLPGSDIKQTASLQMPHLSEEFEPSSPWVFVDSAAFVRVNGHHGRRRFIFSDGVV
jgi:hypothetical protein